MPSYYYWYYFLQFSIKHMIHRGVMMNYYKYSRNQFQWSNKKVGKKTFVRAINRFNVSDCVGSIKPLATQF